MRRSGTCAVAAAGLLAFGLASPVLAEDAEPGPFSGFSGSMGVDFTNAYIFRGIVQEDSGFIAQPWAELRYKLFESDDGPIRSVSVGGGVWNSFHSKETLASSAPTWLYETDWYPLISIGLPAGFSLTTSYVFYTSPNDAFKTVQEVDFKLAWDDSQALGRFAMAPYVNFAAETRNTAFGPNKGSSVQLGAEPTLWSSSHERYPVKFTFPVELGLAINDYYEEADGNENTFGYLNFGLKMSVPLAFVPKELGAWSFAVAAKGYYLSNTLADASNDGHEWQPVVVGSIGVSF